MSKDRSGFVISLESAAQTVDLHPSDVKCAFCTLKQSIETIKSSARLAFPEIRHSATQPGEISPLMKRDK